MEPTFDYIDMLRISLLIVSTLYVVVLSQNSFLGCYKDPPHFKKIQQYMDTTSNHVPRDKCVSECNRLYYRYAFIGQKGDCLCGNYLSEQVSNVSCNGGENFHDTYTTGNVVPGPPRNFQVFNVTERSVKLSWEQPESFIQIIKYKIKLKVLHTYSSFPPFSPEWMYSNNTFRAELITLLPSTEYNVILSTLSPDGEGAAVYQKVRTKIADPEPLPESPVIIQHDGDRITIKINSAQNNNGPISAYKIIVRNSDSKQGIDQDNLMSYDEAKREGLAYYVTAEIEPERQTFIIGDGQVYGKYRNAPLNPHLNYDIILGLISRLDGTEKIAFSDPSISGDRVIVFNVNEPDLSDSPGVIIGLSVAIGLLTFLLIAGIIAFILIKSRVVSMRQRLSADNQELALQGAMIEVENNGYLQEDDHIPVNHYRELKERVEMIPSKELKIEPTNLLGIGKYGRVNSGTFQRNDTVIPIAAYMIQDKKLSQENRKCMLRELDMLIKPGKHNNLIGLIGTNETAQSITVILECNGMNLKDFLLSNREISPEGFSNMSESHAFDFAEQICNGMTHLQSHKIVHKQLCARSISIVNGMLAKIGNYGINQYFNHNKILDYTRWTAAEVFRDQPHNPKSDVWSFGCVLWEMISLGGTPYGNIPNNNDIPPSVLKGLRLPQLQYVSDELYQVMLDCWQLDCDERPTFSNIISILKNLKQDRFQTPLSFKMFPSFQYEQFYPDMELATRPIF